MDVVLACKPYVASAVHSQAPFVVLPHSALSAVMSKRPPVATTKKPMAKQYVDQVLKLTPRLRSSPYRLSASADHLEAWVRGSLPPSGVFDTSAAFLHGAVGEEPQVRAALWEPAEFETAGGVVKLSAASRKHEHQPSKRALIVYACAMAFFEDGDSIGEAIAKGEKCWVRLTQTNADRGRLPVALEDEGDASGTLDLEPRRALDVGASGAKSCHVKNAQGAHAIPLYRARTPWYICVCAPVFDKHIACVMACWA